MSRIDVLVIVNVAKAQRDNTLGGNLWMVDSNKNSMSQNEGTNELVTACTNGDLIVWNITPIDADNDVSITGFIGAAINNGLISPKNQDDGWASHVNGVTSNSVSGQYTMQLSVNGRAMSWDPFIQSAKQS